MAAAAGDPAGECDLAVVGAGIVGLAVARELAERHPRLRLRVLEREPEVARHQTGRNSGVVHAGIYYAPGSLKAKLCVAGARELYEYCERRGTANGVPGLPRLAGDEIAAIEPHARGVAALYSPNTGIADFAGVARNLAG